MKKILEGIYTIELTFPRKKRNKKGQPRGKKGNKSQKRVDIIQIDSKGKEILIGRVYSANFSNLREEINKVIRFSPNHRLPKKKGRIEFDASK